MDEIYAVIASDNQMLPEYYNYHSLMMDPDDRIPVLGSDPEFGLQGSVISESASIHLPNQRDDDDDDDEQDFSVIKSKIASHPSYPRLIHAYINCQKVGAPPEIACLLDEIGIEDYLSKQEPISMCSGIDLELDEFMESYCEVLMKYKSDLWKPFEEATSFLNAMEAQLANLICKDEGEVLIGERMKKEEEEVKHELMRQYGSHISGLRQEFCKKKKKGKLPNEARDTLVQWWNLHHQWPYPTEADKIGLAESTGLDQKQINNWFINQRKRHWKSHDNMHIGQLL